jgi:N-acetylmuramoyl-L-alanine amidase
VIDAGHGGHDPGTIGPGGLQEKDLVLDVALRLDRLVRQELGAEVLLTRSTDVFVPLEERTAIANSRGPTSSCPSTPTRAATRGPAASRPTS